MNVSQLFPLDSFRSKLKNHYIIGVEYDNFMQMKNSRMQEEAILKKMRIINIPDNANKFYSELQNIWEREGMQTFSAFIRRYNSKDVKPTLEAMRKMIDVYHSKRVEMLKLGVNLPYLANSFLHSSTDAAVYPF